MNTTNSVLVRLFIAIELSNEIKLELKNLQDILKPVSPNAAKWVDPSGIHLTLKFLGNVESGKIPMITDAVKEAVSNVSPFELMLKELGAFPDLKRIQVLWVGLQGDLNSLQALQKQIEQKVSPLGFPTEKRSFIPHLTLARLRNIATPVERRALGEKLSVIKFNSTSVLEVKSISLMKSHLTREGAIYTCMYSADLCDTDLCGTCH